MRRRGLVLMVATLTALAVTGAPDAVATPQTAARAVVLPSLPGDSWTQAADINNAGVVAGISDVTPVRWDSTGKITALPVPAGLTWMDVYQITDSGFITGEGTGEDTRGALLWDPKGRLIDMGFPPGIQLTHPTDVNESGTVVGDATGADGAPHALRWDDEGRVTVLSGLRGGTFSHAAAINNQGVSVGYSDVVIQGTHVTHAVKWDAAGRILDLGNPLSTVSSYAVDVNDVDMTAGGLGSQLVRWNHLGRVMVLQVPPDFSSIWPVLMNEDGVVAGLGNTNHTGQQHAVRWDTQGGATRLEDAGYPVTWVNGINRAGTVVGTSQHLGPIPGTTRDTRAAMWDSAGKVTDLGSPVGDRNEATGINDSGVICGTSASGPGMRAVLWYR